MLSLAGIISLLRKMLKEDIRKEVAKELDDEVLAMGRENHKMCCGSREGDSECLRTDTLFAVHEWLFDIYNEN